MEVCKKQKFLKGLLIIQTLGLLIYTVIAIQNDGGNFLARAIEFATSLTWMGQFALDFQCYLILSALWVAWRNNFSINSIVIAIVAMILGIIIFAPYLLFLLSKEKGDLKRVLIGNR
ncbi:hypothetical protein QYS48_30160 [Marivirga arenosa]|uniref:DUF2834 domain-containing protein n=1 Tax=Marivirga arenosa TaxID=3059076 RepID=A0AA51RBD9_9BACT|nr:hypothetical protein [Marivirga sp. ABR2-2]WMN07868.1 hypothetical protein QYS48_30160 [Marivirga sp. ABR2-2]